MQPSERLRAAVAAQALAGGTDPRALAAAEEVVRAGAGSVLGLVFFGSRKTRPSPDPWSAYDFFALVRDYPSFYQAIHAAGKLRRRPWLPAALNEVMPPNQVLVAGPGDPPLRAKCAVMAWHAFLRETSERRHDHFLLGRLFQPAEVVFAVDETARETLVDCLARAHALSYVWVRPWLPLSFDVTNYARTLLRVSLSWEIRPEPAGRADALFEAQRPALEAVYSVLLADLVQAGELRAGDGRFTLAQRAGFIERLRLGFYFRWSRVRATSRWLKYMVTHEGWLDYIIHKAERHTGERIELTERERRWPIVFLWPRFFRYLRRKDRR